MRLSVLLPTRSGARFLPGCLAAILGQDMTDVELVVADNANDDGTREVLARYVGTNMRVVRHETVLPVSDNWNSTLEVATGDYFWMVGDDDLILPEGLAWVKRELERYERPDCLSFGAFSYVAPGSFFPGSEAHWSPSHFRYGGEFVNGSEIAATDRRVLAAEMFRFRPRLPLNMQLTVFSRRAVQGSRPPFFRPPFPDHYALTSMLLTAERWCYSDYRPLVVGVSPKSFGHYFYSGEPDAGMRYLGIAEPEPGLLPGNELLSLMYTWLVMLKKEYPELLRDIDISRGDYIARQMWSWFVAFRLRRISSHDVLKRMGLLRSADVVDLGRLALSAQSWSLLGRRLAQALASRAHSGVGLQWPGLRPVADAPTILAFAELVSTGNLQGTDYSG